MYGAICLLCIDSQSSIFNNRNSSFKQHRPRNKNFNKSDIRVWSTNCNNHKPWLYAHYHCITLQTPRHHHHILVPMLTLIQCIEQHYHCFTHIYIYIYIYTTFCLAYKLEVTTTTTTTYYHQNPNLLCYDFGDPSTFPYKRTQNQETNIVRYDHISIYMYTSSSAVTT